MRIAIAEIIQETDTFSPILTELNAFEINGMYFGQEVIQKMSALGQIGGFFDAARETGSPIEPLPILRARATSGGRISSQALTFFKEKTIAGLRQALPLDGFFFSLHGAAASEELDDFEGHLLTAAREVIGKDVPIAMPLDHHANITRLMMETADVLVGHQTQPHQPFDTGSKAARLLFQIIQGRIHPTAGWRKIPMLTPQDQFLTSAGPMKEWFDLAREIETRPGVLSASTFPMQPWFDVEEGGWAAVVFTENDPALADALADELAKKAWKLRDRFWVSQRVAPAEAIRQAVEADAGLVLLSDTGDSVWGGAPGDSTCLLREMLRQEIPCVALVPIIDPVAVETASKAGIGSTVTLELGAKWDNIFNVPAQTTGRIAAVSDGLVVELTDRGFVKLGKTILLEAGQVKIVIADNRTTAINYPIMYTHLGLDVSEAKMVVLKTASNFQYFDRWRKMLIRVDSPGMTQSDLTQFQWNRVPRPIYPLDLI